eukprot:TRINITY_DN916_c3_g1_i3.p1 TRINITY_DN916_c3_g1~~TRINITY_DN916_c3_g1_i3.p1  ORF type:complete len:445 (-),score=58.21 TRINITY_DN916_c3_g1_i3:49-1383(-)
MGQKNSYNIVEDQQLPSQQPAPQDSSNYEMNSAGEQKYDSDKGHQSSKIVQKNSNINYKELLAKIEESQLEEAIALSAALDTSQTKQATAQEQEEIQEAIGLVEAVEVLEKNGEQIDWELNLKYFANACSSSSKQQDDEKDELKAALERISVLEAKLAAAQLSQGFFDVGVDFVEFGESGWHCQSCTKWNEDSHTQECSVCHMGREETDCPICLDTISGGDLFVVSMCNHHFHRECAKQSVLADMNCNNVPIQCPVCKTSKCEQCGFVVGSGPDEEGGNCCMFNQRDIKDLLDNNDYERYLNIEVRETCKTYQYFYCPGVNCGQYYDVEQEQQQVACPYCEFTVCLECGVPWHEGSTCKKYQQWQKENKQGDTKFEEKKLSGFLLAVNKQFIFELVIRFGSCLISKRSFESIWLKIWLLRWWWECRQQWGLWQLGALQQVLPIS